MNILRNIARMTKHTEPDGNLILHSLVPFKIDWDCFFKNKKCDIGTEIKSLYKIYFYKNNEAQICPKIKNKLRTFEAQQMLLQVFIEKHNTSRHYMSLQVFLQLPIQFKVLFSTVGLLTEHRVPVKTD